MRSVSTCLLSIIVLLVFVSLTSGQFGGQQTTYSQTTETRTQPVGYGGVQQQQTTITKTTSFGGQGQSYGQNYG